MQELDDGSVLGFDGDLGGARRTQQPLERVGLDHIEPGASAAENLPSSSVTNLATVPEPRAVMRMVAPVPADPGRPGRGEPVAPGIAGPPSPSPR